MDRKETRSRGSSATFSEEGQRILTLGVLAELSTAKLGEVEVTLDTLRLEIRERFRTDIPTERLRDDVNRILTTHKWFGLAWTDSTRTRLATIAGVRWFCRSSMYEKLVANKPKYRDLSEQFAELVQELGGRYTEPRLLVDAGSTTFHCLFHDRCQQLRWGLRALLTNNLFVALRFQEEFNDRGPVQLIGGAPHLATAATVDNEKLHQWLRAKSRRPEVSLLSWHYVEPKNGGKGLDLYTKDSRELEMKKAAMEMTAGVIYVPWSKDKIKTKVPEGGKRYSIVEQLLDSQAEDKNREREVYFITDLTKKDLDGAGPSPQEVVKFFSQKKVKDQRVWLKCPHTCTRPRGGL